MAKERNFTLNRKQYERIRKMDHNTMSCWAETIYENGYQDGKDAATGPTAEEVLATVGEVKGIGSKKLNDIENAIKTLFSGKSEIKRA